METVKKTENLIEWAEALMPMLISTHDYAEKKKKGTDEAKGNGKWSKVTENVVSIRFTDCDPFGHLNNGRYIDYFINGRDFQMDQYYGVHLAKHALQTNETYVVKGHQIAYLEPAHLRERVKIRATLLHYNDTMTFVESQMLDEKGKQLKSLLWSQFSYIDLKKKMVTRQPNWILEILKDTVSPLDAFKRKDFEGRIKELQNDLRKGAD
jgi:acyl-CoA thioesterase FadM